MREAGGKRFLYVLNSSVDKEQEGDILIRGTVRRVVDQGLRRAIIAPTKSEQGMTIIKMKLAPAEGTLLVVE